MIIPFVVVLGAGALALVLLSKGAEATPPPSAPEIYVPTADDILNSANFAELYAYYNLIGELYITGEITLEDYQEFYAAYESRYYELASGGIAYRYEDLPEACICDNCGYVWENPGEHCKYLTCPSCGAQMWRVTGSRL